GPAPARDHGSLHCRLFAHASVISFAPLPARARLERRALLEPGRLTVGAKRLRDCLDVLQELLPGLGRALLVRLDPLDRIRGCSLDVALVRPQDLRLQLQRRGPEDLPDRRVVEERVLEAQPALARSEENTSEL